MTRASATRARREDWLDAAARALGRAHPRRALLQLMGGSLGALLLSVQGDTPGGARPHRRHCRRPKIRCSGKCVDLDTDPDNCGECNGLCAFGEGCIGGVCCPQQWENCDGTCVNILADPANCGACGRKCRTGQECFELPSPPGGGSGTAVCICRDGLANCAERCVDVDTDPANCGDCGLTCPPGFGCEGGVCQCNGPEHGVCAGACVDQAHDSRTCGKSCTNCGTSPCCNGRCTPPDKDNCGACGRKCPPDKPACFGFNQCCDANGKCV